MIFIPKTERYSSHIQRFIFILLCVLLLNVVPVLSQETEPEEPHYIIGVAQGLAPYSFIDKDGLAAGYSVDMINAIAEVMQVDIEVVIAPWGEIRQDLEGGIIDAAPMYYSEQQAKVVDFTQPYATVHNAIFVRKNASVIIETEEDLRGKEIIVIQGDIMHDYALENNLTDNLIVVSSEPDALKLLDSGEHDLALMAQLTGLYWVKQLELSAIKTTGPLLLPSEIRYAVTKDNAELRDILSEGLAALGENGEHARIHDKWPAILLPSASSSLNFRIISLLRNPNF